MTTRARLIVAFIRSHADRWMLVWALLLVAGGLMPLATVVVTRGIVDHLVPAVASRGDWAVVRPLVVWAVLAAAVVVATQAVASALSWVRTVQTERLRDRITARIHEQSARVDLAFYDSPDFFDRLHRARDEASYRPAALLDACGDVLQGAITLVAMAAMLMVFGSWLPGALVAGALPVLFVVARHARIEQQWRRDATADERRTWYHDTVLTSSEYAAEVRLFDLSRHFRAAHDALRTKLRTERLDLARRRGVAEAAAAGGGVVVTGAAFGWMLWRAVFGAVSLGQLAAFYQAFSQGLATMRALLGGLGRLYANSLFMENLVEFLELQPRVVDPAVPAPAPVQLTRGIRFTDVTFRYPDTERMALAGFSLFVPAGKIVAIVGPNGSGKSTLVKLLSRLYDPESGAIEFDDVDLRAMAVADVRRAVTVLFQEPARYAESVAANIQMGIAAEGVASPKLPEYQAAAKAGGVTGFASLLPQGFDTLLGKRFEQGTELSAGEWQRIALARAFLRPSPIVVLDEPTSALDPWAEADWFRRFRAASVGRTALIITHRFTTAMQADVIHVMERGRIVESGSHEELLARGGRYAASWSEQYYAGRQAGQRAMGSRLGEVGLSGVIHA